MVATLMVLFVACVFFISGKVRSDLVAICALLTLLILGILTPAEALAGFSNSVVIMMIALFIVGGGIFQTGLAKMISKKMLKFAGTSEPRLLITVILVTALLGAFVSNTGTVAVMLPIVVSLAMSAHIHPARLLMPLAFASSFGGMLTLIGTPPNLVIQDILESNGYESLSFFSFTPTGIVILVTGSIALVFLRRFLPKHEESELQRENGNSLRDLARKYQLSNNLYRVKVGKDSPLCTKKLSELAISSTYGINIIEIRRKSSPKNQFFKTLNQEVAGPDTVIDEGDILYINALFTNAKKFADDHLLDMLTKQEMEKKGNGHEGEHYATNDVGIAEVMLTPNSRLIGKLVKESGFREKYRINILGIQRKEQLILQNLKDEKIRFGDCLLVQGFWKDIARLAEEREDYVVVGEPLEESRKVTLAHKAPIAAGILLLMIALLVTEIVPAVAAVLIAAVLMVVFGCVRGMEEAYKTINWESVVLIGAMIPMSTAIENTGAAEMISNGLVQFLGQYGPLALLAGIYFLASILTVFISNTACALLIAPIALTTALHLQVSPYPFLFAVAIASSLAFATPFGTPPNAMVMSAGRYRFIDYVKVGLPLQLIIGVVIVFVLPFIFPF